MICVIPGLIWPSIGAAETLNNLPLPGLAALQGCAKIEYAPVQPLETWLVEQFSVGDNPPLAAIRLAGENTFLSEKPIVSTDERGKWLCADPVSLMFAREHLLLSSPESLDVEPEEATALINALNENFKDLGRFYAATPTRWYLRTQVEIGVLFHPLADVIGRPIALFQPEGENLRFWSLIANELQVFCYNHPVNAAREAAGKPLINALWLWGSGHRLDSNPQQAPALHLAPPGARLASTQPILPLLAGLTRLAEIPLQSIGEKPYEADWAMVSALIEPTLQRDALAWSQALRHVDALVLQPLWRALRQGKLKKLRIVAPCENSMLIMDCQPLPRWQFWRKAASQAEIIQLLTPRQKQSQTA